MLSRDIEFLYEIGSLRNMPRGWAQHLGTDSASTIEHSFRVVFLALALARAEGVKDTAKVMQMALVHDLTDTRLSDLGYVQKVYVKEDGAKAEEDLFGGTSFDDWRTSILKEYHARESLEAKVVKDADNLDVDLELKELEERGHKIPAKVAELRRMVRDEKLYTDSARAFWDAIQTSDVSSWHLATNKWLKIPSAGK